MRILLTIDWLALHGQMEAVEAKTGLMQRLAEILPARDRMILQFSWLIYPQCGNRITIDFWRSTVSGIRGL